METIDEHLTRDLFRAIHQGWRNPGDLAAVAMAHLFELCSSCRQEFEGWRGELGEGVAAREGDFDAVLDRMRAPAAANDGSPAAVEARVEAERKRARSRVEELLGLPADQRLEWIRKEKGRHSGLLLAEVLIEESRRRTPDHPHEGCSLANLARIVLQHAPSSVYAVELYARALARLGNAIRVIGDLPRAEQILSDARFLLRAQAGGDRMIGAELDSLQGSLRWCQDRSVEAISLLLRALMAYRLDGQDPKAEAACLIKLSNAHARGGEVDRAIELSNQLQCHPAVEDDPYLYNVSRSNVAGFLTTAGKFAEARTALEESRTGMGHSEGSLLGLRLSWTEAKILYGMGERLEAEAMLHSVRRGFSCEGLRYDQAQASMVLAGWYHEQGRHQEAEPLVEEALPVFRSLDLPTRIAAAEALRDRIAASL